MTQKTLLPLLILNIFIILSFVDQASCDGSTALVLTTPNIFRDRTEIDATKLDFSEIWKVINLENECHIDVDIEWEATLGSATFAPPIIGDFRNDGRKEIIIPTIAEYIEVVDGEDGEKEPGWPFILPNSRFMAGAVDYDLEGDGARDLIVATDEAELLFISESGLPYIGLTLKVPRLGVEKDWFASIDSKYVYFALHSRLPSLETRKKEEEYRINNLYAKLSQFMLNDDKTANEKFKYLYKTSFEKHIFEQKDKLQKFQEIELNHQQNENNKFSFRKIMAFIGDDDDDDLEDERGEREYESKPLSGFQGIQGWLTNDGVESLELFLPSETSTSFITQLRHQVNPLYSPQYEQYMKTIAPKEDPDLIYIDPHIVATPVVADLNKDGRNDLIVAVNYFFKSNSNRFKQYNIESSKYIACGIVVFDLTIHQIKWISPLDLSTETQRLRASISSSPTIIDIDGDGYLDILVATAVGHIYALNQYGTMIEGFPIIMHSIYAPLVVEDIDEDGKLDIIAIDSVSTIAVFDRFGKIKWEKHISRGVVSAPSIGDIDADGDLDIAVLSPDGHLWVLDGKTGQNLKHFPARFPRGNSISPTLLRLNQNTHLHIIIQTLEGHMYIIDGKTACVETVDLGQKGNSVILADDVTGNGKIDLIATGISRVTCLATDTPYHPMNVWKPQNGHKNVFTTWRQGVFFSLETREMRDITGSSFTVQFEIFDARKLPSRHNREYNVKIFLRKDMEPFFSYTYNEPGIYVVTLPSPNLRFTGSLRLEMINEIGQSFEDSISLSFNAKFYRSIKWVILVPFAIATFVILFFKDIQRAVSLV